MTETPGVLSQTLAQLTDATLHCSKSLLGSAMSHALPLRSQLPVPHSLPASLPPSELGQSDSLWLRGHDYLEEQ